MRHWLAVLCILLLAACAGGSPPGPKAASIRAHPGQSMVQRAPTLTDEEVVDYIAEAAEAKLKGICGARQTIRSQLACVREAVMQGFDTTGEARRHCDIEGSLDGVMECVMIGSLGYELALRANLEGSQDFNWRDTEGSLKGTVNELGSNVMRDCLKVDLDKVDGCVLDRIGTAFSLADGQVSACTDPADTDRSIDCLVRSFLLQSVEQALDRMGPGDGLQV